MSSIPRSNVLKVAPAVLLALSATSPVVFADSEVPVTRLDAIVVTASGFEQLVEDAPASISVIPREDLEKKAYKDVTDALRDVPGVLITGGGSSSDISIRGMGSGDRKSTRLNSSHVANSYAVFCLKK